MKHSSLIVLYLFWLNTFSAPLVFIHTVIALFFARVSKPLTTRTMCVVYIIRSMQACICKLRLHARAASPSRQVAIDAGTGDEDDAWML